MGNLVLTRKPGESIDIYDLDNASTGVIVITQGKIVGQKSSIAIDAPLQFKVKRSEILGKQPAIENKYYSLGPDPIAAIKSIGFTSEVGRFGVLAYVHESLPLDMRHHRNCVGCIEIARCKVNQTLIDNLRYVLQNMRLQKGDMAKVQADIVAQAISEIDLMGCRIEDLRNHIITLEDKFSRATDFEADQ